MTLADLSGHSATADVLFVIAAAVAVVCAVLRVLARDVESVLLPVAVALIAVGLALL